MAAKKSSPTIASVAGKRTASACASPDDDIIAVDAKAFVRSGARPRDETLREFLGSGRAALRRRRIGS